MPIAAITPSPIRALLALSRRPGTVSFAGGLPDAALFPRAELAEDAARVLAEGGCLQYAGSEGLPALREWLAARLVLRGLHVTPGQVFITNGSQHALQVALSALAGPGETVALDAPAYPGARQAAELGGAAVADADLTGAGGCDPEALAALVRRHRPRALVAMPTARNPTGATLDPAGRAALAEGCRQHRLALVEDDAYADLWYRDPPPPALAAQLPDAVLTGSFSKILAPGLRLGWLCVPPALVEAVSLRLQATCLHANGLSQAVLMAWLGRGGLDAHLDRLRAAYRQRRDALVAGLARHLPGCTTAQPDGGMFCWLRLPEGVAASALARRALDLGVATVPEAAFHAGGAPDRHLRLSFAGADDQALATGLPRLAEALAGGGGWGE